MNTTGMNGQEQCNGFQIKSGMTHGGSGYPVQSGMTKGMTTPPDSSLRSRMTRGRRWSTGQGGNDERNQAARQARNDKLRFIA